MEIADPAKAEVEADLDSPRFRIGVVRKQWRVEWFEFPHLLITIAATKPDGAAGKYSFRFELSRFRGTAPLVQIWDAEKNHLLPEDRRPKGSERVTQAFKNWQPPDTIYRPWERSAIAHNNWHVTHPELTWTPSRDLTFVLEDLHALLNLHVSAGDIRPAA